MILTSLGRREAVVGSNKKVIGEFALRRLLNVVEEQDRIVPSVTPFAKTPRIQKRKFLTPLSNNRFQLFLTFE